MKARPIPFSAPMIRAIQAGTKSQTRRVVKEPQWATPRTLHLFNGWPWAIDPYKGDRDVPCPFGQPGDLLWVKEAWRTERQFDHLPPSKLNRTTKATPIQYEAGPHADVLDGRLRPGMFMPRWASRITLEVTGVRVERLQDISEADAVAEGVPNSLHLGGGRFARENFEHLWWTINGEGSWDANPWVWVVEFRRAG